MAALRAVVLALALTSAATGVAAARVAHAVDNESAQAADTNPPPGNVSATIWLDRTQVEEYEQVRLNLLIRNVHATEARTFSQVDLRLPGLGTVGDCWDESAPTCANGGASRARSWTVPAQGSLLLWGEVRRLSAVGGAHVLSGTYAWSAGDGKATPASVVPLSVEFPGPRPFGMAREWLDFLKDMVLPLTLIALAWVLQRVQQSRAERQVVWANMLEKVHTNAEKYYLPATMAMDTLRLKLLALEPLHMRQASDFETSLLQLLVLFKRMRLMVRRIGGFYFKDRSGERAVARAWEVFYRGARAHIDVEALDLLVDAIDPFESESQFAERKAVPTFASACQTVQSGMATWAGATLPLCLHSLSLCARLFDAETNRPFELWYGEQESIPYEQIGEMRGRLAAVIGPSSSIAPLEREACQRLDMALDVYVRRNPPA